MLQIPAVHATATPGNSRLRWVQSLYTRYPPEILMVDETKFPPEKNLPAGYVPPKVWTNTASGGAFASINRPVAGPTHEKELPVGRHPLQLYSLGTPNGVKVTIMLEELLAAGHSGAEYDAWL